MDQAQVASLHLHPVRPGDPLDAVSSIDVVAGKGIRHEPRYFGRINRASGKPSLRQVSLIECEQISEHAAALGLASIGPGLVRSNIETAGIRLVPLLGKEIEIGTAVLLLYAPRDPCDKMDRVCPGLRTLMLNRRQGVLAQVVSSGTIRIGDKILVKS